MTHAVSRLPIKRKRTPPHSRLIAAMPKVPEGGGRGSAPFRKPSLFPVFLRARFPAHPSNCARINAMIFFSSRDTLT